MNSAGDWELKKSTVGDIDRLMKWFPDEQSTVVWGGPGFRYPFTRHSFAEDMHWGKMASYRLSNADGQFAAFGQFYERLGCINLARLVANPEMRGQGVGKRLVGMLMQAGQPLFACSRFSLFVYRDNTSAYECYKSMGFVTTAYPDSVPMGDVCDYLTRSVDHPENQNAP